MRAFVWQIIVYEYTSCRICNFMESKNKTDHRFSERNRKENLFRPQQGVPLVPENTHSVAYVTSWNKKELKQLIKAKRVSGKFTVSMVVSVSLAIA